MGLTPIGETEDYLKKLLMVMIITNCPKLKSCPIFIDNVLHDEIVGETYKKLYCLAAASKYMSCKRYIISEKYNVPIPPTIMPNSSLSLEAIAKRMGLSD